jgi:hypothetical protein
MQRTGTRHHECGDPARGVAQRKICIMNTQEKGVQLQPLAKRLSPWRSSLYEEPLWVSLAWVLIPATLAALAIFLTLR